jgi:hypothetical protein
MQIRRASGGGRAPAASGDGRGPAPGIFLHFWVGDGGGVVGASYEWSHGGRRYRLPDLLPRRWSRRGNTKGASEVGRQADGSAYARRLSGWGSRGWRRAMGGWI